MSSKASESEGDEVEPVLWAATISASTALVVAVIGIFATGRAQRGAAEQAHRNALDLLRGKQDQAAARAAEAAERMRLAHSADRRDAYVRFMTLTGAFANIKTDAERSSVAVDEAEANGQLSTDQLRFLYERGSETARAYSEVLRQLTEAHETITIIAPAPLAFASVQWMTALMSNAPADKRASEYLRLVRLDLGVDQPR